MPKKNFLDYHHTETGEKFLYIFDDSAAQRHLLLEELERDVNDSECPLTIAAALNIAYYSASFPLDPLASLGAEFDTNP